MKSEMIFEKNAQQELNLLSNEGFDVFVLVRKRDNQSQKPVQFMNVDDVPFSIESLQKQGRTGRFGASISHGSEESFPKLTQRERDVLALIANGYTRYEVAEVLSISHNTAAKYIKNTYLKLKVSSVAEATQKAILMGVIEI